MRMTIPVMVLALVGCGGSTSSRTAGSREAGRAPPGAALPTQLHKDDILGVVRARFADLHACLEAVERDAPGQMIAFLVIERDGRVSRAEVREGSGHPDADACVRDQVRSFRFPRFSGEPMQIHIPIRF